VVKVKDMNEMGFVVVKDPIIVDWLKSTQKSRNANISDEIAEGIIRLLNDKALSISQVAFKLRISHEKARRHLFYMWKNGYILRSKYPKERELVFVTGANPVTMLFYTYAVNNGSEKVPFITFEGWIKLKKDVVF